MSVVSRIIGTAERVPLPDLLIRAAIQRLCSRTATRLANGDAASDALFAGEMAARAIAECADAANAQHYEVPAAFFARVLGPNRKYSSSSAAAGVRCRYGWRGSFQNPESSRCRIRSRNGNISRARLRYAD